MTPPPTPPDNSDPRDYILDLSTSIPNPPHVMPTELQQNDRRSSFISIHFKCCNVYAPIYKNAAGTAYAGHCPRCRRPAQIGISPTGSSSRIFTAE